MTLRWRVSALLAVTAHALPVGARAADPVHESVYQATREFLSQQIGAHGARTQIELGVLDPRLRLPPCGNALRTSWIGGQATYGRATVGVQCIGPASWTVYVTASIKTYGKVVLAAHPLARGDVLSDSDVTVVEQDLTALARGYISDPGQVIGHQMRRPASANSVITPQALEPQTVVRRGQQVTILAKAGGLEVRSSGTVLGDGATGERVQVRNLTSKRIIEATVTGAGVVEIVM